MFLKSLEYSQYENRKAEWQLEGCTFGDINLIVGQNATGKTRTLNIINGLASMLSGEEKVRYQSGNYKAVFDSDGKKVAYLLKYERNKILKERLDFDSENYLRRRSDSTGIIRYEKEGRPLEFQTPPDELVSSARRDSIQHPSLEVLYTWGRSVRLYRFGGSLGQETFQLVAKSAHREKPEQVNLKQTDNVVPLFRRWKRLFGAVFEESIMRDMSAIGYELEEVDVARPTSLRISGNIPADLLGLYIKERDLKSATDQREMSQGMFRALSLLIQLNYFQLADSQGCILIDDIGEGLDYERSSALVRLLIEKFEGTANQLVMATNDRFVMNAVPLQYWSIMHRIGGKARVFNYRNSPQVFDDFELTGLNNFDFFSSKYYHRLIEEND